MVGRTISRFRVLRALGRGGMGEVYLAEDPALGRKVALKFMPESLRNNPTALKRFLREPRAAASLDHPFICKIYETGEADGTPFIVMEYVEGVTLQERLAAGPMPLEEALGAAGEIAEALETAHQRGIVHRDLKPANILVTRQGHVKVMDFGLAKRVLTSDRAAQEDSETLSDLTADGFVPGTIAYMSPEQLRGRATTPQCDIFSFGVVLYQMLSGVHPFARGSRADTIDAILNFPQPPLSRYRDGVPELLEHTTRKMLSKDPAMRYQSVQEVRTDLLLIGREAAPPSSSRPSGVKARPRLRARGVWTLLGAGVVALAIFTALQIRSPGTAPRKTIEGSAASIAVLPFMDLSHEGDQEYFCDGIAEQIISTLTRIEGLHVTARTSAFAFKGKSQDVREIGRQLNVDELLEGSVRKEGSTLRITVQLVSTADGFHVWSKEFARDMTHVLRIQDEIAQEVARALEVRSAGELLTSARSTGSPEAYNLYLKGRYFWNKRTPESLETAIQLFEQAILKDPDYALAHVGLADAYNLLEVYKGVAPGRAAARAKAAVARALQIDDSLAEAHATSAVLEEQEWDYKTAEKEYRRALELNPGDATVRSWYAQLLAGLSRFPEALFEIQRACKLDPLSPYTNAIHGNVLYLARRYDDAKRQIDVALELDPRYHLALETLAYLYVREGRFEQASATARSAAEIANDTDTSVVLAYACAASGRREQALGILERMVDLWKQGKGAPGRIAVVYAGLGDREQALVWLERARREHDIWITQLRVDPIFDGLRSDDRFKSLLREVGFEG